MNECKHCEGIKTEVTEIRTIVGRMDRELFGNGDGDTGRLAKQDREIRQLQMWRSWITGGLAVLIAISPRSIGGWITNIFHKP